MKLRSLFGRWSSLYLVFPIGCFLLWLEHQAPVPPVWHGMLLFVSVGVIYGLLALWCGANSRALDRSEATKQRALLIKPADQRTAAAVQPVVRPLPQPAPINRRYQLALLPAMIVIATKLSNGHLLAERKNENEQ